MCVLPRRVLLSSCLLSAFIGLLGLSVERLAAAEGFVVVKLKDFKCLIENVSDYLESAEDPLVVILEHCPKVDLDSAAIMALAQNAYLPKIGASSETRFDRVISLTKKELLCLQSFDAARLKPLEGGELVPIPEDICELSDGL